ncbi:metal-binding protein (plasmid) [Burkholderia sp. PAMC 28687]|uniref:CHAD domain-containing protein n=1 Tax=Burkholderia sp. PAMC 28687 TaxID=1795874 RepID=UPI0007848B77|nr:CHAD domain-containing protein [Burkholderia sp. PAMC 28687]AMM18720.1 metal-binding protein [Burkholderia sp. PAMC 28687]
MKKTSEKAIGETAESSFNRFAEPLIHVALTQASSLEAEPDAEKLHKLRVSLRQLRTLLWAYRPLLNSTFDSQQRAIYKFLANAAGSTRDWDILIGLVEEHVNEEMLSILLQRRAEAAKQSSETLSHANIKNVLRDALSESNRELNTAAQRTVLKKFARKRLSSARLALRKRIKKASRARHSDYSPFHEVRKAGKKVRYLVEFFDPLLAEKQRGELKGLKRLQKRFGALNDVVASRDLLNNHLASLTHEVHAKPAMRALRREQKKRLKAAAKLL